MNRTVRLALAQINCTVGDLEGNGCKIISAIIEAGDLGADLVAFPEMAVTGYPPEDLLFKDSFIEENRRELDRIARACTSLVAVVGFADSDGRDIYNAAAVLAGGEIRGIYHKMILPNYGVFDEMRYFREGTSCPVFDLGDAVFGINICEDIWHADGPARLQAAEGKATLLVNINASPYHAGKYEEREGLITGRARENGLAIAYVNLVGGQDELVFDGGSLVVDADGSILARAPRFEEALLLADIPLPEQKGRPARTTIVETCHLDAPPSKKKAPIVPAEPELPGRREEIYRALTLGTRDYVLKSGFKQVLVGLSGGIDSALTAAIAVDALGAPAVMGVAMPSRYSSEGSLKDAETLAKNLGIAFEVLSIEKPFAAFLETLGPLFAGFPPDLTDENIQARIRGILLMALSNKFGRMVLTTGNKSEVGVGYATLYGDMAGGFAVLKDVPKTLVYELSKHRNEKAGFDLIPENSIAKAPSAELRPDQTDQDSLPPYDTLDAILKLYVEEHRSLAGIVAAGFDEETAARVIRLVNGSEYKRRQGAPGVKITPKAFGRDRRMPIVNAYRDEKAS